ncbi:MAG: hypothetical protein LBG79_08280 [Spirochaetaceae bacterium]|nr:hypothetical protein [Spirochaetaceae bacterium]GMO20958.1 MAG: DNA-3-methyladenine glycosylase [Termitinemataceae bacterium]
MYTVKENSIYIDSSEPFDIKKIAYSGQMFRVKESAEGLDIISSNKRCLVKSAGKQVVIECNQNESDYFIKYFDLESSYLKMNRELAKNKSGQLLKAIEYGSGLRILNQDYFEALISFIISSNNNIKRIQKIINALCAELGENKNDFFAFPNAESMAARDVKFYEAIGAGYRAPWLLTAAELVTKTVDLSELNALPTNELIKKLQSFNGIGPKVADCIALFAYHRFDVFPVDTWVKKIYNDIFGRDASAVKMRNDFLLYFEDYPGLAQQYLFYYYRSNA